MKTLLCVSLLLATLVSFSASADGINVQTFTPPANATYTFTESATPGFGFADRPEITRRYLLGLDYNYYKSPLVILNADRTERDGVIVDSVQTLDAQIGAQIQDWISLHLAAPMHLVARANTANEFSVGDLRAFAKLYAPKDWVPFRLALVPELRFPTGDTTLFTSDSSVGFGASLAAEKDFGNVLVAANIGYRHVSGATYSDAAFVDAIDYTDRMPFAIGLNIPFAERWALNGEFSGAMVLPSNRYQNPTDLYAGLRYKVSDSVIAHAGGGVARTNSIAAGDYRIVAGLRFSPYEERRNEPAPKPAPAAPAPKKRVVFTPKEIQINEEVKFEHNSDVLTASAKEILDEVAQVIKENQASFKSISIEGHTNRLGSDAYNLKLSKARAKSVREYLASRGVDPKRLSSEGYGKRRPKPGLEGLSDEARLAADRRVEFKVIK